MNRIRNITKIRETRNANKIKSASFRLAEISQINIPEPPEPKESYEHEELDLEDGRLAIYGKKDRELKGPTDYRPASI